MLRMSVRPGLIASLIAAAVWLVTPRSAMANQLPDGFSVLITNDDGYNTPGLRALVEAFSSAHVTVVAPYVQQSGAGTSISYREAIMIRTVHRSDTLVWYAVDARPATVVRVALRELMDHTPDLVISGINTSENVGSAVWASGTLGAAREGALAGIPSIAISLDGRSRQNELDFRAGAEWLVAFVGDLIGRGNLGDLELLNVNIPAGARDGVSGVALVNHRLVAGVQEYERQRGPRGQDYVWDMWRPDPPSDSVVDDVSALEHGWITITPLSVSQNDPSKWGMLEFADTQEAN